MPDTSAFGHRMAARTRPRLGNSLRMHRSSAIGAVGRSTLGFGRIIATAGSSRPTVTPEVSATRSLRPPLGVWTLFGGVDEPEPSPVPWTTRALPTSASVMRRPAPPAPAPKPVKPVDSRADALRRMLESRGMIEPSETTDPEPTTPTVVAQAVADAAPAASPGDRTATTAGSATAPGQFGRRVRPEPTRPDSPLSSVFPESAPAPGTRRPATRAQGDDLDRFRRSLESRGMMSPSNDGAAPSRGDGTVRRSAPPESQPSRSNERSTPARPEPTNDADADTDSVPARNLPLTLTTQMGSETFRRQAPGDERPATTERLRPHLSRNPVVTRAAEGRRATVAVRRRMAGRRFLTPQAAAAPTPDVRSFDASTPISAAALAAALTAEAPALRAPAPSAYDTPIRRSAVAPGPGALARALESGLASATTAATPTPQFRSNDPMRSELPATDRSPGDRTAPASPPVRRTADDQTSIPAPDAPASAPPAIDRPTADPAATTQPTAPASSIERPETPDPTAVAAATADRLDSTSPDHTVISRSPDDRTAPTPSIDRPAADHPVTSRAPDDRTASAPAPAPAIDRPDTSRPAAPDPTAIAADTAHLLDSPSPDGTIVSRSPADDRATPPPTPAPAVDRPDASRPAAPDPTAIAADTAHLLDSPSPDRTIVSRTPDGQTSPAPTPSADRSTTPRPATPDPAVIAAATAELLASASPERTVISRSPADERAVPTAPSADLGERFLRELGRSPDVAARELPRPFQPLATAITGSARQVRLSTDATTRRALDSVGKQAVTVGDTIHLARPVGNDARTHEVLAHELVHVANPSPVPRFFDDDHRGPEERMAEQVAQVIRRSPIVPASPVPSAGATAATRAAAGAASAGASARSGAAGSTDTIRRSPVGSASPQSPFPTADQIQRVPDISVRRAEADVAEAEVDVSGGGGAEGGGKVSKAWIIDSGTREERDWFDSLVERTVDRVVQRIEQRVLIEFERRGGRHWRNF